MAAIIAITLLVKTNNHLNPWNPKKQVRYFDESSSYGQPVWPKALHHYFKNELFSERMVRNIHWSGGFLCKHDDIVKSDEEASRRVSQRHSTVSVTPSLIGIVRFLTVDVGVVTKDVQLSNGTKINSINSISNANWLVTFLNRNLHAENESSPDQKTNASDQAEFLSQFRINGVGGHLDQFESQFTHQRRRKITNHWLMNKYSFITFGRRYNADNNNSPGLLFRPTFSCSFISPFQLATHTYCT